MNNTRAIAAFCIDQVEQLVQPDHFVPVGLLARRLGASVMLRPLLVEAMLASLEGKSEAHTADQSSWLLLLDSERFAVTDEDIERETPSSPLPARLRNTVAHELIHSLSFRPGRHGPTLELKSKGTNKGGAIADIERKTEKLSPLLLIPQSALVDLSKRESLTIAGLQELRRQCAVSNEVLISRLNLLMFIDPSGIRFGTSLENVAVGLGEWVDGETAHLLSWPLFVNFERGWIPDFIHYLKRHQKSVASDVTLDAVFYLNGGDQSAVEFDVNDAMGGLAYLEMRVRLSVEVVPRRAKSRFLFLVSRIE